MFKDSCCSGNAISGTVVVLQGTISSVTLVIEHRTGTFRVGGLPIERRSLYPSLRHRWFPEYISCGLMRQKTKWLGKDWNRNESSWQSLLAWDSWTQDSPLAISAQVSFGGRLEAVGSYVSSNLVMRLLRQTCSKTNDRAPLRSWHEHTRVFYETGFLLVLFWGNRLLFEFVVADAVVSLGVSRFLEKVIVVQTQLCQRGLRIAEGARLVDLGIFASSDSMFRASRTYLVFSFSGFGTNLLWR